jgi:hypothetical protein
MPKSKSRSRRKEAPKRALSDLEHVKTAVAEQSVVTARTRWKRADRAMG